jgi:cation:H+ antiporter
VDLVVLAVAFVVILLGAELFTNGVEWFGRKLGLAEGAVGSVLAAVGTALPETTIPIVAILFSSGEHSSEVGLGAILGAPFMLATLAMFVTGAAVMWQARSRDAGDEMPLDGGVVRADLLSFFAMYGLAIGAAIVLPTDPAWPKLLVAAVLLLAYGRYVVKHFAADPAVDLEDLAPLRLHRLDARARREQPEVPRLRIVSVQVLVALGCIVVGAVAFVDAVDAIARGIGVSEVLLALVIAPIATELPEKLNSVIWIRQGKDTLAVGNITGAMVFQSAIPVSVALVFAPQTWAVGPGSYTAFASAGIALLATAVIFAPYLAGGAARRLHGRRLLVGGGLYVLYLVLVAVVISVG